MAISSQWQQTTSGGAFDGAAPVGVAVFDHGVARFTAAASSLGLFDPGNAATPLWLERFTFHATGAVAWTLSIVGSDSGPVSTVLASGTTDTDIVTAEFADRVIIMPGEKLKLVSAGGGGITMTAQAVYEDRLIE